jgi:hypothetical protein
MAEKSILARFNLRRKPAPKKSTAVKIRLPVKIQTILIDKRDSGYNRNELKRRLLEKKIPIREAIKRPVVRKKKQAGLQIKVKGKIKLGKIKLGEKITKGTITMLEERAENQEEIAEDLIKIDKQLLDIRLPPVEPKVLLRASSYFMNNREFFINFINSLFEPYRKDILSNKSSVSCDSKDIDFSLLTHQKIVRDYINNYTPYRGLLLYHGLGSGKTCSSIAIAEGLKSEKQIIIMTPASLKTNYIEELKKCGDSLYRYKQFWEFIKIEKGSPLEEAVSRALSLPKRLIIKQGGAWLVDARKESNFAQLSQNEKMSLDSQINKMIQSKYRFINYNGLRESHLKALTQSGRIKNPFKNKVIIIDEAHNFVSRIVNKIGRKTSLSLKLYEWLKDAENSRIVFLTGTPIINYPNELGVLFNMLRGNIKTYNILLNIKTKSKIDQKFFEKVFEGEGLNTIDFIRYNASTKKLIITRNPFGFVNNHNNSKYDGVDLNEQGNLLDKSLFIKLKRILKKNNIFIEKIDIDNYTALPDTLEAFKTYFIGTDGKMKNINVFKKRILGLTSYYRSAHEGLLPSYDPDNNLIVEKIPMSLYQLGIYEGARADERDQSKKKGKRKRMQLKKADGIYEDTGSTYRIFSRLFCNFVFPTEIKRPLPQKNYDMAETVTQELNEDLLDNSSLEAQLENIDGRFTSEDINTMAEEKEEKVDNSYDKRIIAALRGLKLNASSFLSKEGLKTYSPKFLKILENIEKNSGLHLIYSQFRTLEGIGILKLILEENGFVEFKIKKRGIIWEILAPENLGKPSFVLYTGTETSEEKEILRNIFNNDWDKVPANITEQISQIGNNNSHGEIIKIFMITAAGAEGISLKNVRYVHITEPYWHPVRLEQVIGRARRICSHHSLPEEERNVSVFLYLMTFSDEFIKEEKLSIELRLHDTSKLENNKPLTSDEALYEISNIKESINKQLLKAVKESSMDCFLYAKMGGKEKLSCFSIGAANKNLFLYPPSISQTETDKAANLNVKRITWKAKVITIKKIRYAYRVNETDPSNIKHEIYDLESYKLGTPLLKGELIMKDKKPKGVKWV